MPETLATIDFAPIACAIAYALAMPDGSQCRSDCIQVKLTAFCYGYDLGVRSDQPKRATILASHSSGFKLSSDAREGIKQSDSIQVILGGFCYHLGWYRMLGLG